MVKLFFSVLLKPETLICTCSLAGFGTRFIDILAEEKLLIPLVNVIVKFLSFISKKTFPTASTLIRQVAIVAVRVGTVIIWLPLLATPFISFVKVVPPL